MVTIAYDKYVIFEDLFRLLGKPKWLTSDNDITTILDNNIGNILMNYNLINTAKTQGKLLNNQQDYLKYILNICSEHCNIRANSVSQRMTPMSEQKILSIIYGV